MFFFSLLYFKLFITLILLDAFLNIDDVKIYCEVAIMTRQDDNLFNFFVFIKTIFQITQNYSSSRKPHQNLDKYLSFTQIISVKLRAVYAFVTWKVEQVVNPKVITYIKVNGIKKV